ncbi:MAG: hypothetical protein V1818_04400 [Candidatus Aenigmatarchaeota archaeon]
MKIFADLHLHSHYSRATSNRMNIENLERYGKLKGLNLIGTGDFTHPLWLKELKGILKEVDGFYKYKESSVSFVLQAEVAIIYRQDEKSRRVHLVLLAPSFGVVDQVNDFLSKYGKLASDGRPILTKIDCAELTERLMQISKDIMVIPAHCLLPNTKIIANPEVKSIEDVKRGDFVYTHTGLKRKVTKVFSHRYRGKLLKITPWYFSVETPSTPEHPFLAIKTKKNCSWTSGICKPSETHLKRCNSEEHKKYHPEWIQAKNLEIGDVLVYPRFREKNIDVGHIAFGDRKIELDRDFCRLVGYYLAEGYTQGNEAITFTFNKKEKGYVFDVCFLMRKIFGLKPSKGKTESDAIFYSKAITEKFKELFYTRKPYRAFNKKLPEDFIYLPEEKQVEILKGWWRGDKGSTSSRLLANQMKIVCLRLGIIPSFTIDTVQSHKERGKHLIGDREIRAKHDNFILHRLSFFEDRLNLLKDPAFKKCVSKTKMRHGWLDGRFIYIPIRKIDIAFYDGNVLNLEVEKDNSYLTESAAVHNCWTPWFALFGSKSGFDRIEDCFKDQTKNIFALETGLSSDPAMNWRLSALDKYTLISNSDSHSPWPSRIGREANVFNAEMTYKDVLDVLKKKDPKRFLYTIEVDPSWGKYHWDGHRACNVCMSPKESLKHKNICPVCKRELTIGVEHRVEELADREDGFRPDGAIPFKKIIPLSELIATVYNTQSFAKKVWAESSKLLNEFGSEFKVLLETPEENLRIVTHEKIAKLIIKNRNGDLKIHPGYDGEYGKLILEEEGYIKQPQKRLDSFTK